MIECRAAEQAPLGDIGRAVTRKAALAFDRFDHRAFLAADIGAGAAADFDRAGGGQAGFRERLDFAVEDFQHGWIFVAHVDVDVFCFHRPGGNERAFEQAVRIVLEVMPVLEGAGLAFVAVYRHQPWAGVGPDDLHFVPAGKPAPPDRAAPRRKAWR